MQMEFDWKSSPRRRLAPRALIAAVVLILLPAPALAYIDPGTGSFVIQGIIAAVVGAGLVFKVFWHRIKSVFTGKTAAEDDDIDE
jgi:hypothetical protein